MEEIWVTAITESLSETLWKRDDQLGQDKISHWSIMVTSWEEMSPIEKDSQTEITFWNPQLNDEFNGALRQNL